MVKRTRLTQACPVEQCEKVYEHKVTQRYAVQEWNHSAICRARMEELLRGTKGQQRLEEAVIDRVVEDSLDKEIEEMVADNVKKEVSRHDWSIKPRLKKRNTSRR